jgi:hypothetical protein
VLPLCVCISRRMLICLFDIMASMALNILTSDQIGKTLTNLDDLGRTLECLGMLGRLIFKKTTSSSGAAAPCMSGSLHFMQRRK